MDVHKFSPMTMRDGTLARHDNGRTPSDDVHMIPARFKVNDRVRVKFGVDRGHYGTIVSQSGEHGHYYGLKLDCHDKPIGYSDYELEAA